MVSLVSPLMRFRRACGGRRFQRAADGHAKRIIALQTKFGFGFINKIFEVNSPIWMRATQLEALAAARHCCHGRHMTPCHSCVIGDECLRAKLVLEKEGGSYRALSGHIGR